MSTLAALLLAVPLAAVLGVGGWFYTPDLPPAGLERAYAGDGTASRFVEVDGLRIHYRDEGEGPPVVLLHGLATSLFLWDAWAERLQGHRRVIRLDLPGHGLTGPDPQGRYAWPQTAAIVVRLLDRLGVERADIVGSSLGGAVAWQMAARHPERVDRLVLVAPVGYPPPGAGEGGGSGGGRLPLVFRLLAQPGLGPFLARMTPEREFARRVRATYGDPSRLRPEEARQEWEMFRRAGNRDAFSAMLRSAGGGPMPDARPLLAGIRAQTLVLWGSADPIVPPAMAALFARDIPGAKVAFVRGAGHAPMRELPDESLAPVVEFLAATTTSR